MERRIHRSLLGLVLLSAGTYGWQAFLPGDAFPVSWHFHRGVFVAVMMGSIPATILLVLPLRLLLGRGRDRLVWIVKPARTFLHQSDQPVDGVLARARTRLEQLGFTCEAADGAAGTPRVVFHKAKAPKVVKFTDHAFSGGLTLRREGGATHAEATIVFEDTVVVETGESDRILALARYLVGAEPELRTATIPFTLVCGVVIAVSQALLRPIPALEPWMAYHALSITLAAVGMILLGGYPILQNRSENYGVGLGLVGLVTALFPLFA